MNPKLDLSTWDNKTLYNKIIARLTKEFGQLPKDGVLAGQAVASALYEIVELPVVGRYKDLDVFYCKEKDNDYKSIFVEDIKDRTQVKRMVSSGLLYSGLNSFDMVESTPIHKTSYSILCSNIDNKNEKINNILVQINKNDINAYNNINQVENPALSIISAFDLNLVQIGLNIKDKTVCWTEDFQEFLYSRQLLVSWFGTPMHTAVRILDKQKSITGIYVNINEEMKKLQTIRAITKHSEETRLTHIPGNLFGDVYTYKYNQNKEALDPYWRVEPVHIEKYNATFLEMKPIDFCEKTFDFINREMPRYIEEGDVDDLYSVFHLIYKAMNPVTKIDLNRASFIENYNKNRTSKTWFMLELMLRNDKFMFYGLQEKNIDDYLRIFKSHPFIINLVSERSTIEQLKVFELINWMDKKNMRSIIGMVESKELSIDHILKADKKGIKEVYSKYVSKIDNNKSTTLFNPTKINDVFITELNTEREFFLQGEKERHCVGGYYKSARIKECFIYSLTSNQNGKTISSTAMLKIARVYDETKKKHHLELYTVQHYAVGNTQVHETHSSALQAFVKQKNLFVSIFSRLSELCAECFIDDQNINKILEKANIFDKQNEHHYKQNKREGAFDNEITW